MKHYCTYFDKNYLIRGLTLYRSLIKYSTDFQLFVLCLDNETHDILHRLNQPDITPIKLQELETDVPELLKARNNRGLIEYYFTLTPVLPLYILEQNKDIGMITYLDADLFFYSNTEPIYDELGNNSILMIEHRFPTHLKHLEEYGIFNVQFLTFRNDTAGKECLAWWKDQCLNWCYDRLENGKFADQKYLDEWPKRFKKVTVLQHKGAGLAPWNWINYDIRINESHNKVFVDGQDLIFYHFHSLKLINNYLISHGLAYGGIMPVRLRRWFYRGYVDHLRKTSKWISNSIQTKHPIVYSDARGDRSIFRTIISGLKNRQLMWVYGFTRSEDDIYEDNRG